MDTTATATANLTAPSSEPKIAVNSEVSTTNKPPLKKAIIIILILMGSMAIALWSWSKMLSKNTEFDELTRSNALLLSRNEELIKQNEKLNAEILDLKKTKNESALGSEGDQKASVIKHLTLKKTWSEADLEFRLTDAYFSDTLSDADDFQTNSEIVGKSFVTLKIEVTDDRVTGIQRLVSQGANLTLTVGTEKLNPVLNSIRYILPEETISTYSTFAVEKDVSKGTLTFGTKTAPQKVELDFDNASTVKGELSYDEGFTPTEDVQ